MSKRGRTIQSQSRELIVKLHDYFERESLNGGPLVPVAQVHDRIIDALGIGTKTIRKVLKEKYGPSGSEDNVLRTPKKRKKSKPVTGIDSFDADAIRNHIYGYYSRKEYPTVSKLLVSLKEAGLFTGSATSLVTVMKQIGFEYKKSDQRKIIMERYDLVLLRVSFLKKMNKITDWDNVVFIDETWLNSNHTVPQSWTDDTKASCSNVPMGKGGRLIICHAGSAGGGFVDNALLAFESKSTKEYHEEMDAVKFKEWFATSLLPNLPHKSIIIMDNAPYHSIHIDKPPTQANKKADIVAWLERHGIEADLNSLKAELLQLVRENKPTTPRYEIDELAQEHGHTVIRTPPYHCQYNAIELIWAQVKARQTHPATGIEHSVSCCFFNNDEPCLVTAGANIIKVFRLYPEADSKEVNAAGQPIPPKMKLECLATYTLWGSVMSLAVVPAPSMGRDLLLLSFREAKLSVVQYDPQVHNLVTLSMHYFEEDDMKNGWTTHPHIPYIRVDPSGRCCVMLLYGRKLAVIPFRKDCGDEADPLDAKPGQDLKKNAPPIQPIRTPTLASYVIVLKDLDEKIDNVLDIQFLHGYYEPTLLLLYEPVRTFAGRTAVRNDTCCMAGVSLNMTARSHPVIWATAGLPHDCLQAIPVDRPLGGCLIFAVNSLIYLNQSVPPYGVSLNSIATHTTNFPLRIQEGVCITLDCACAAPLGDSRLAISLKGGQLFVLTLLSDSLRSVRSFHLARAAASVLPTCMCVIQDDFLFLGSRLGNSLLLRVTERENRMLFSVDKPLQATVDLTTENASAKPHQESQENPAEKDQETEKDKDKDTSDPAAKKRRMDTLSDCIASNVIDISDQDELEVYGSDIRTSTQLTSYVFEVCDSLLNICPIGDISMGEPQLLSTPATDTDAPLVELVACSGRGKNGALTVLQRTVHTHRVTQFTLPGCIDMWSVFGDGSSEGRREQSDSEASHAYLILTQTNSSMILQTGEEINEVDNSGFMTSAPTVFAGNLGNNKYMVQVTTTAIRLIKNGAQIQSIQLEWTAASAYTADPYLCVVSTCARAAVLALRETHGRGGASARLVPTRQAVPHMPAIVKAQPYRDLSGLFTTSDVDSVQVKGEFTGKNKGKKKVKAEGFKPDTVYELNDEDELLYGGDQTPASMATIMLQEQSKNPGVPRRVSRWWRKYLQDVKPTYWLFVVRDNGNLEIYSLPEMRLSFLVQGVCEGHRILADSLESVSVTPDQSEEPLNTSTNQSSGAESLQELLVVALGNKGARPLLLLRTQNQLLIYQAYKYPRGNLKLRFCRLQIPFAHGYAGLEPDKDPNYEHWLLKDNVRQLRYFAAVSGYQGVLICGRTPYLLLLGGRGEPRLHPLQAPALAAAAAFNNVNCAHGLMYFDTQSELHICVLPSHLSYDSAWPVRKVPIRMSPHFVTYHVESKTYCLVGSHSQPQTSYYKFNGEDKENTQENKGDRFPYPHQAQFSVCLFSPVSWEMIPNSRVELEPWEHVACLSNCALEYQGTRSGLRGYIVLGTNYNYSEDITSRGRIIIYDIIDVVPEPGQPLTKNKFKEIYAKEQKGPVTALSQVLGLLVSAIGQKIYIWQLKDKDLVGVAFIDTQIYVHRMMSVNNLILVADVYKSISLLRYQEAHRTLALVARDLHTCNIYDMEFMVDNTTLGFLASESEGNLVLFMYQPQARESYGGQRLIRKADFHLGQQVHAMFRINARGSAQHRRHVTMYTTLDGGIGYVLPVTEKMYRRLLMLQNVMTNYCRHHAGLNPRAFRTYKTARKPLGGGAARGILDGDLVSLYQAMPAPDQREIAKKIGTKVEEIQADLYEVDRLTAHF